MIKKSLFIAGALFFMVADAFMAMGIRATNTVSVLEFGARPNDGCDDTNALRKAVAYCRSHPGTTLIMPEGEYILRDPEAEKLETEVLAGKMGNDPEKVIFTPYYPYVEGLDFTGAKDVTVWGKGAVLKCFGWMEPISMIDCTNFKLIGLSIDYGRKPFSEGIVKEVQADNFVIEFYGDRQITDKTPFPRLMLWNDSVGAMYWKPYYFLKHEIMNPHTVRFKGSLPTYMANAPVTAPHSFHFRPGIFIYRSSNILIEDVSIHSQPGMGIVGFDSRDITMHRLNVVPADGYNFSTNTDATHFACCDGYLIFDECMFRGQGDDATNVHGYYHNIQSIEGDWVTLVLKAPTFTHAQITDVPRVGDVLELSPIANLVPEFTTKVVEVLHEPKSTEVKVRLDKSLPENYKDYYVFNINKLPKLQFRRCTVWGHLGRGVLCKTRDVVIEDNVFRGCTGSAIHIGAESYWMEGSHSENVIVRRNIMLDCGLDGGKFGASGIAVCIEAPQIENTYIHKNISIYDNTIVSHSNNQSGITVRNTKDVDIRNNRIVGCAHPVVYLSVDKVNIK